MQKKDEIVIKAQKEISNGDRYKASLIVESLWESGGQLSLEKEIVYIGILINLGYWENAFQLLKMKFDNIDCFIEDFQALMLKFSVLTGNIVLLQKMLIFLPENDRKNYQVFIEQVEKLKAKDTVEFYLKTYNLYSRELSIEYDYKMYEKDEVLFLEIEIFVGKEFDEESFMENVEKDIKNFSKRNEAYQLIFIYPKINVRS